MDLDGTDRAILRVLGENARTPFSEIAHRVNETTDTVRDRVNRMEDAGVIEGYHAAVNAPALGYDLEAFVGLEVTQRNVDDVIAALDPIEAVRDRHLTAGEWDLLLRVVVEDAAALRDLVYDRIAGIEDVDRSRTLLVLDGETNVGDPQL
ncbi:transcriptional regulator, AsnC family [Halopenitus malekzadehii]|uniref:Transcriptional regulator, AsnC family n=1 Tax=Halopenitus malekzadehii TaxID=1267564 RepID=A0A1H6JK42_9EURY|nr:Lrp/AsnC family transcriptional regulator [Halopenitus malekzadehii]SEH62701.1 transcriptional regulator, AsnC family [Halopenitus malekzadehii]